MTLELTQDVSRPPINSEQNWADSIVVKEGLLAGKKDTAQETALAQRDLTDRGIIPDLQLEDQSRLHESAEQQRSGYNRPGIFDKIDVDDNRFLTASEWTDRFDKMAGADQRANLDDFYRTFGRNDRTETLFNKANKNGGKSVGATEWLGQFSRLERDKDDDEVVGKGEFSRVWKKSPGVFAQIDADKDSELTAKEWVDKFDRIAGEDQTATRQDFLKGFGGGERAERLFKSANKDGDDNVSMSEWLNRFQRLEGKDKNFTVDRSEFNEHKKDGSDNGDQYVSRPDPSKYESQEHMEFLARLAAHDQQLNGSTQPNGPQGTIFLQTLLDFKAGGKLNGQSETFLKGDTAEETEQRRRWFFQAMADSVNPETGQLEGNVLSQAIVDTVYDASGMDISDDINQATHLPAQTSPEAMAVTGPGDPMDPDFIDNLSKSSGWNKKDIAADLLWGHAQVFSQDGKLNDEDVRNFLQSALSGNDPNTSGLINAFPEIEQAARDILASDHPAERLGELFLSAQSKQFGVPLDSEYSLSNSQHYGDDTNMIFSPSDMNQSNESLRTNFMDRFVNDLRRAADTGNNGLINQTLNNFGDRFQNLANQLLKNRTASKDAQEQSKEEEKQRGCPFMALKDKFGGSKS